MADKKIGENFYRVPPILATEALKLQFRLLGFAGPAVKALPAVLASRQGGSIEDRAKAEAAGLDAIASVFTNADPSKITTFISDVCEMAHVSEDGKTYEPVIFDHHLSDDQKSILPLAFFVLKELLGDFFTGVQEVGSLAASRKPD